MLTIKELYYVKFDTYSWVNKKIAILCIKKRKKDSLMCDKNIKDIYKNGIKKGYYLHVHSYKDVTQITKSQKKF